MRGLLPLAGFAWATATAPAAHAWGNLLLIESPPTATTFAAGPSLWRLPAYPGSSRSDITLLPGLDWYGANGVFASTDTGLGWNLSTRKDTQAGLRLWPHLGRTGRDVPPGVGGVGPRLQLEAFANHAPWDVLLLQSGLLYGAGLHHDGVQMEFGATSGIPIGPDLLGIGLSASYGNRAYRQSYFGITQAQSQASGLAPVTLGAGLNDTSLTLSIEHKFGTTWRVDGQWIRVLMARPVATPTLGIARRLQVGTLTLWREF